MKTPEPAIAWHWGRCVGCGEPVYVKESELLFETVRVGCCGATPVNFGNAIDPARAHAKGDAPGLRCATCGYEKEFGEPPADGSGAKETTMAKSKKTAKANGKGKGAQPSLPSRSADGAERVEKRREHRELPCAVDPEKQQEAGRQLADTFDEQAMIEDERRTVMAGFRSRLNHVKERAKELTAIVRQGTEQRSVLCIDYLLPTNEIETVRQDTGKVVGRRTARADELQLELPETDDEATAGDQPEAPFGDASQESAATTRGKGKRKGNEAKGNGSAESLEATP